MSEIDDTKKLLTAAQKAVSIGITNLIYETDGILQSKQHGSADSLVAELSSTFQPVVIDGMIIEPPGSKTIALREVEEATEKQRELRIQYEKDRAFFENRILSKARGLGEIQEDFIKVLHPFYREKFIRGIEKYGTVAAAMKWMKDNHGLKLRGDVLRRMSIMIPSFKQEIDDAMEEYQATLHMEVHRRAVEGVDKGIYHAGEMINSEKVYSDSLLVKMLDTHNPEYKEAKQKDGGKGGGIVNVQIIKDFHNYKDT